MRKLFKILFVSSIVVLTSLSNLLAQDNKTTSGTATVDETVVNESTDYVTIGSIMPYNVTPFDFGNLAADYNSSYFTWSIATGVENTDWKYYNPADGSQITAASMTTNTLSAININWITKADYTISVAEVSNPKIGTGCTGVIEDIFVKVVDRPTVAWSAPKSVGQCNTATGLSYNIPIDITGSDRFNVAITCVYTPLTGASSNTLTNANQVLTIGDVFDGTVVETLTAQTVYTLVIPAGTYGKYEFTFTNLSDRISRKSGIATIGDTDFSTTDKYTVMSYPTPTTGKIKHVSNTIAW